PTPPAAPAAPSYPQRPHPPGLHPVPLHHSYKQPFNFGPVTIGIYPRSVSSILASGVVAKRRALGRIGVLTRLLTSVGVATTDAAALVQASRSDAATGTGDWLATHHDANGHAGDAKQHHHKSQ